MQIERDGTACRARTRTRREPLILTGFRQGAEIGFGIWHGEEQDDPGTVLVGLAGSLAEAMGELVAMAHHASELRTETAAYLVGAMATTTA